MKTEKEKTELINLNDIKIIESHIDDLMQNTGMGSKEIKRILNRMKRRLKQRGKEIK